MRIEPSDIDSLRPLLAAIAREAVEASRGAEAKVPDGRLAFPEPEAAGLLGLRPHVLRDCRLRGELSGKKAGKQTIYSRDELLKWLAKRDA